MARNRGDDDRATRAPTEDGLDTARTNPRVRIDSPELLETDGVGRYIPWLERIASALSNAGKLDDLATCESLIAELRSAGVPPLPPAAPPLEQADLGPMGAEVAAVLRAMRGIVRALGTGYLELDPSLRAELAELVRDIVESIMTRDLGKRPAE